ncbi:MAG: ACT domain-containing protein, partial [Thermodesulfovibrionales bacterium]|nr:ACT domain-containing protein [Thermodesulfovibrionales bacterium]
EDGDSTSPAKLSIEAMDRPGILASLSAVISAANVNISYVKANTTTDKRAIIELILEIKNKNQLFDIQNKIAQLKDVVNVSRI